MSRARTLVLFALGLVAAVVAVYAPVRGHDWVRYDDDVYLLENPHVARGLDADAIAWVFTHEHAANYHPLTWVSHMLDVQLFGMDPGAHHLVNVGLHSLNAVLVLLLLAALLESPWAAGIGAALFALHPLRVESVAWASERKDVLCAALLLAALLAYLWYGRRPAPSRYALVCLLLVLALLAKPMAVTFPALVLLLDVWPLRRLGGPRAPGVSARRAVLLEKLPLLVLAALGALATLWAQQRGGSTSSLGELALGLRIQNAFAALGRYLQQTFWPLELSVFYPHAAMVSPEPAHRLLVPALAGGALLAGLLALAWRARRAAPAITVGIGFFLVTLLPVIGVVQVGTQAHADRYTYLPSVGLAAALAGAARWIGAGRGRRTWAAAGLAAAAALAPLTRAQLAVWKDTRSLFEHALALDPRNYLAHAKLGELALTAGDGPAARAAFEQALAIQPAHLDALNNLALVELAEGDTARARALLARALALAPDEYDTWLNLGAVELESGDLAAARARFEACLARAPDDPDAHFDLGLVSQREGDGTQAELRFRAALALDQEHADAWSKLGQVLRAAGRIAESLEAFARVVELVPDDPFAHFNLAVARRRAGDRDGARHAFERALALEPALEPARAALDALEAGG
jgi:Tfp pilus assembly protein PilF